MRAVFICVLLSCFFLTLWTTTSTNTYSGSNADNDNRWGIFSFFRGQKRKPLAFPSANLIRYIPSSSSSIDAKIPAMLHQTSKTHQTSRQDPTIKWSNQCQNINKQMDFFHYDDVALEHFVEKQFSEYLALYQSLSGICKLHIFLSLRCQFNLKSNFFQ